MTLNLTLTTDNSSNTNLSIISKTAQAQTETIDCECDYCLPYNKDDLWVFLTCICKEDPLDCCDCPMSM